MASNRGRDAQDVRASTMAEARGLPLAVLMKRKGGLCFVAIVGRGAARLFPNHQLIQVRTFESPLTRAGDAVKGQRARIH